MDKKSIAIAALALVVIALFSLLTHPTVVKEPMRLNLYEGQAIPLDENLVLVFEETGKSGLRRSPFELAIYSTSSNHWIILEHADGTKEKLRSAKVERVWNTSMTGDDRVWLGMTEMNIVIENTVIDASSEGFRGCVTVTIRYV